MSAANSPLHTRIIGKISDLSDPKPNSRLGYCDGNIAHIVLRCGDKSMSPHTEIMFRYGKSYKIH
jgi:hypothetical protein